MIKVGILGGTFDPPHRGHLKIAKTAKKRLCLDLILFVPCNRHILKRTKPSASSYHRSNMISLLCLNEDSFIVENCELEKGGISYTSETLSFLKRKYKNAKFFLLIGKDSYDSIDSWKSPQKIRELSTIVVFPRGNEDIVLKDKRDIAIKMAKIDISSTQIRNSIYQRSSLYKKQVSKPLLRYIIKEGLYLGKESR